MNKLFTTIFAVAVAFATASGQAQEIKGDAKAGETKNAMCIGCHGIKGYQSSFPEIYKVPMISGQSAAYISSALHAYKKGDRKYPSMRGIAESLTDQDIADLAAYYSASGVVAGATLPADPKAPSPAVQALLNKANCASCHGANFSKPIDPSYPKIAGQHADYLFVALKSYKMDPGNAKVGRGNAIMAGMAKQYTNAELKALAGYLSSVDGELKTVPESRFR
ncbi:MAG: cytochrome c4 [Polaromonas sp.]|uniref:c-type cytochrome n=1 Tax=Polaromonas sp. TaxID=1869339 RepID=UPI0025E68207|nr:c-type cytochrome [Polaromonas sp.]MBI2726094.1 cytochrome c4 [Polaromonas sp.]